MRPSSSRRTVEEEHGDYFARPLMKPKQPQRRKDFQFWHDMPGELKMEILRFLSPREIVRCSVVSKAWHKMCFDGQLWAKLDTSEFYRDIPADALIKIVTSAGPFVKDLNLRGCVQLQCKWNYKGLSDACRNLENFSLEGCKIDRTAIHCFLLQNTRLVHINLCGLEHATNDAMKIVAQYCPRVEYLNVSWCPKVTTTGLRKVIEACDHLKDLRAGEIRGWDDLNFVNEIFQRNTLERLILTNCDSLTDESVVALMEGIGNEVDFLTGRPSVSPRKLRHLDLTRCRSITDKAIKAMINNVPYLEGLQISKCGAVTDLPLSDLLRTTPRLTHLDLEELEQLTNASLQELAKSPCRDRLEHLSISYCENLGDAGMLPVIKACPNLKSLDMDNTRVSDLVLTEVAAVVRQRPPKPIRAGSHAQRRPSIAVRLVVYDCQNVTWTGVREVLSRNADIRRLSLPSSTGGPSAANQKQIVGIKCFHNWQPTVAEHTKRVLRGDFAAANRLERKWAAFMMATEEAGAAGQGNSAGRRRRRAVRQARAVFNDEEEADAGALGITGADGADGNGGGRRRRARSGGCVVM